MDQNGTVYVCVSSVHVAPQREGPSGHEHRSGAKTTRVLAAILGGEAGEALQGHVPLCSLKLVSASMFIWPRSGCRGQHSESCVSVQMFSEMPARITVQNMRPMELVHPPWLTHGDGRIRGKAASKSTRRMLIAS